jgi:hypothetical protein
MRLITRPKAEVPPSLFFVLVALLAGVARVLTAVAGGFAARRCAARRARARARARPRARGVVAAGPPPLEPEVGPPPLARGEPPLPPPLDPVFPPDPDPPPPLDPLGLPPPPELPEDGGTT